MNANVKYHGTVIIDGAEIPSANIVAVEVKEWIFDMLPRLKLIFNDLDGAMEHIPLTAQSKIYVSMAVNDESDVQLSCLFNIADYQSIEYGNGHRIFVTGYMSQRRDGNQLWGVGSACYKSMASSSVLGEIISGCGYNFSNDGMTAGDSRDWYRLNESSYQFIHHVLGSSMGDGDLPLLYGTSDGTIHATTVGELIGQRVHSDMVYDPRFIREGGIPEPTPIYYMNMDLKNLNNSLKRRSVHGIDLTAVDLLTGDEIRTVSYPSDGFGGKIYQDDRYTGVSSDWGYLGVIDPDAVDINLLKANYENRRLMDEYFAVSISVEMSSHQHVDIGKILNMQVLSVSDKNESVPTVNRYLSGKVIVSGVTHAATPSIGYKKAMVVSRSGMGL